MTLTDFLVNVLPDVPACPQQLASRTLISVLDDFCRKTRCWTEFQEPIPLIADISEYELDYPLGAKALEIKSMTCNGLPLWPATISQLMDLSPSWETDTGGAPARYTSPTEYGLFRVWPTPSSVNGETLVARVSYAPKVAATSIPDDIAERYQYPLACGTKWRLMAMPNCAWSNPEMAAYFKGEYEQNALTARIEMTHERVEGTIRARPVRFG